MCLILWGLGAGPGPKSDGRPGPSQALVPYLEPGPGLCTPECERANDTANVENAVVVNINKQAKQPYGEGPQISVSVGDRLSREQAIQIADTYETTLIAITAAEENTSSVLHG